MRELGLWDDRSEHSPYDFPDVGHQLQVSDRSVDTEVAKTATDAVPIAASSERLWNFANRTVPSHWHDDVEAVAVRHGRMIYNVNGQTVPMKPGEGIFVNSRQLHFANQASGAMSDCDYICVRIHPSLLCLTEDFKQSFILPVIEHGAAFAFLSRDVAWQHDILTKVLSMFDIRESHGECSTAPLKALSEAAALWVLLFENLPRNGNSANIEDHDLMAVRNMVGFIQRGYIDALSLADIAEAGAMGISKCCRLFAKYFEQSPVSYLNRHRLEHGAELLRLTDKSVTEITLAVGFDGASYFAESFRKWSGQSPTEFRKERMQKDRASR